MTRDEVKKLLGLMTLQFSNFKLERPTETVDAWYMILAEHNKDDIMRAYTTFINSNSSGFAPAISQLVGLVHQNEDLAVICVSEAWAKVRTAIARSGYNSLEEFNKLDPLIQKAVGSAEQLHYWAIDENYNDDVVMSIFSKNYQAIVKRDATERRLPAEARAQLEQLRKDRAAQIESNAFLIGQKADKLQEGDFDYEEPQRPEEKTLGHFAQELRDMLGGSNG